MRTPKPLAAVATIIALAVMGIGAQDLTLPNKPSGTLKFAVIGDSGTGDSNQYRLAKVFTDMHQRFAYEFVLMMGDNMYGGESARDFQKKFEIPYKPLLDKGIKFYASLGNHDSTNQKMYKLFNMNGERFYTFRPQNGVRLFAPVPGCVHSIVPSARPAKLATVFGALLSKSSTVKFPSEVSKCASVGMGDIVTRK